MKLCSILIPPALELGACAEAGAGRAVGAPAFIPAVRVVEAARPVQSAEAGLLDGRLAGSGTVSADAGPLPRAKEAKRPAVRGTDGDAALHSVRLYPWTEGALYRLSAAIEQISDIALEPGEGLISVAAGDTARWVIGDTQSGSGLARRSHVLVKPTMAGLRTNLIIATDRRVYHLLLESNARTAMSSIAWTYPTDPLIALRGADAMAATFAAVISGGPAYRIEGDNPPWRPLRAFANGGQVYIEFPAGMLHGEAPPLFVRGEGGRAELVNYRVRGHYYVVDRLFAAAELRLGAKRPQVVRIVRAPSTQRGTK